MFAGEREGLGTRLLPAKCVLNVLFLVTDFQPSRCVETYSRAVFYASDRNGVDLVSHSATITVSNQTGLKLCKLYLFNAHLITRFKAHFSTHLIG